MQNSAERSTELEWSFKFPKPCMFTVRNIGPINQPIITASTFYSGDAKSLPVGLQDNNKNNAANNKYLNNKNRLILFLLTQRNQN